MRIALIGLRQSGRSTLFRLLVGEGGGTERGGVGLGTAEVPDPRVDALSAAFRPRKTTRARLELADLPALETGGDAGGTGPSAAAFLQQVQEAELLVHVCRAFASDYVPHPLGSVDPLRDARRVEEELVLADWSMLSRRLERMAKETSRADVARQQEKALLERVAAALEEGRPVRVEGFEESEDRLLRPYTLLSQKPCLLVLNLDEEGWSRAARGEAALEGQAALETWAAEHGLSTIMVSAELERQVEELEPQDRGEFLQELGISERGLDRVARAAYGACGLISFFTVGEDEVKAWTVRRGASALEAAGKIHSDIARGFIRAEVCAYEAFQRLGSLQRAREEGALRLEGKGYTVQDGDIVHFRFNV
ncbi:DUF933 domain-containing protein [Limnochorda pilosa]|uniref:GTP-binding protein YchF n=1 Tax=Limnochorda pilosa TaxID=1555112 RepID=A0A0K2SIP1_LIMPI|nr:DUF933 domain-containing protein [Limnochorda pilosa]BAS26978.1 GTP-binding protein YchF [Limnochorda pilosa]